jgi:hypothetical protein
MCPSYMATREEEHSTRGRANALVKALSSRTPGPSWRTTGSTRSWTSASSARRARRSVRSHVDMATMKSEALRPSTSPARHPIAGARLRARPGAQPAGRRLAPLSNRAGGHRSGPWLMERVLGIDRRRPLPRFKRETLSRWFAPPAAAGTGRRGGRGPGVPSSSSPTPSPATPSRRSAGPPSSCSRGRLGGRAGRATSAAAARSSRRDAPTSETGTSTACCSSTGWAAGPRRGPHRRVRAVVHSHPEGRGAALSAGSGPEMEAAGAIAGQARLADDLLAEALADGALRSIRAPVAGRPIVFHGHCHQKAAGHSEGSVRSCRASPEPVDVLDAGCCGMAGSFGFEREHYECPCASGDSGSSRR